ncbi:MAG: serine/threonine-protein kinase [Nannocystaceae bacterium]
MASHSRRAGRRQRLEWTARGAALRGGEHVGRYVILYTLGRGGMGVVYAAYDPQLDRKLAIKVMRPRGRREAQRAELLREAQALARLSDPHVVAVHDVGLVGDRVFVAMDLVDGQTLRRWALASPRSVPEIVRAYVQAGQGLAAAHHAGIVHRDFKPDNALIGKDGRVQVLDFGLARVRDGERATPSDGEDRRDDGDPPAAPAARRCTWRPNNTWAAMPGPRATSGRCVHRCTKRCGAGCPSPATTTPPSPRRSCAGPCPIRRGSPAWARGCDARSSAASPAIRSSASSRWRRWWRSCALRSRAVARSASPSPAWSSASRRARPCSRATGWVDRRRASACPSASPRRGTRTAPRRSPRPCAAPAAAMRRRPPPGSRPRSTASSRVGSRAGATCEASVVRHEQSAELLDLRMACLDSQRERLVALVDTLQRADGDVADRALQATGPCRIWLRAPTRPPCAGANPCPPTTTSARRSKSCACAWPMPAPWSRPARPPTRSRSPRSRPAARTSTRTTPPPRRPSWPWAARSICSGARPKAELALRRAAIAAEHADDDRLLADTRTLLVSVAGAQQERRGDGELWAELAAAALERLGHDARREATLEHNLSRVLEQNGKPEDVLEHQRRALALASEPGVMGELERAPLYSSLAMTLSDTGEHDEALSRARAALDIWQRAYGDDHPGTAGAVGAVGIVLDRRGDLRGALQWYERSHAAFARVLGEDNPRTADMLTNVAVAALELGDIERGISLLQRALAAHTAATGDHSADVAQDHQNLGSALRLAGRIDEALAHHRAALSIREGLFGPDDIRVAHSLVGVANVLEDDLKRPQESYGLRTRALALEERAWGPDHPQLSLALANLGHNALALGETDAALRHAERAVRLSSDAAVPAETRAFAELVLALVLARRGDDDARARSLLERGRAGAGRDIDGAAAGLIAATEAALGRARVSPRPAPRRAPAPPRP